MFIEYDVIVVGAGHAGCEAAAAAANLGSRVLLITMDMNKIAQMSCNPAMGGIAKGQIVREIDAIGGYSGLVSDRSTIQFRMLNRSKGPAMWSPRTQNDRMLFSQYWREYLEQTPNVDFWQDMVVDIKTKDNSVCAVVTGMGQEIRCKSLVLTSGTFLNGIIHIGQKQFGGGRIGEKASFGITESLVRLGFESGRMKTGTPPRVDGRSLDYSKMEEQAGDEQPEKFSYSAETTAIKNQRCCWITYTNEEVHEVLKTGFEDSPMYAGRIQGLGPRYCPSIEDKINRFAERNRHQIFVEPEGWNTVEIYVNGFSTSLPDHIQYKAIQLIPGFEKAKIFRPGYAIEYDYFPPTQLKLSLETQLIENLYFAGQINGTTGYEEAACQGLMAGINAHQKINEKDAFILGRSEAYIGVLIDDLVNKGTDEPYRMFTSRAEYRLMLRQDNADIRLTKKSHELGLASDQRLKDVEEKVKQTNEIINYFTKTSISPSEVNPMLAELGTTAIPQNYKLTQILSRPQIDLPLMIDKLDSVKAFLAEYSKDALIQAEVLMKYSGYLEKEKLLVDKMNRLEDFKIKDDFDFLSIKSISLEAREKLNKQRPKTIGQAARISGISPSDVSILMVHLGR
ncbi:MAG: tRNA uridine-5-carboxymethylaminomethyl(34) synthesis enzyme MnmG [Sphingobacteriales bacterium]|jgi:tRNA uridine 5-carboxymethylaminomethyl modification enzyme|nr:tRNA uridine-5-carboxymethylaminomethyl(34) synthesis enzyme MnmG [Sphingobacteriales bacterium]